MSTTNNNQRLGIAVQILSGGDFIATQSLEIIKETAIKAFIIADFMIEENNKNTKEIK